MPPPHVNPWTASLNSGCMGGKGVEDNSWGERFVMFWSSLLEGLEMLDLFLIVLDRIQLLMASSALLSLSTKSMQAQPWDVYLRSGSCSDPKGYWTEGKIATHFLESLRNKMHQKENASVGCWWFLEENLICDLWFGLQHCECMDFLAVEMRHLGGLASAGLLWAVLSKKSHINLISPCRPKQLLCSKILCMALLAEIFGQQHRYSAPSV